MKTLNKENLAVLQNEINEAMAPILKEHGLIVENMSGKYGGMGGELKYRFAIATHDGLSADAEANWIRHAKFIRDIEPEWFGEKFIASAGEEHQIIAFKNNAPKNQILTRCGGKEFAWPKATVALYMRARDASRAEA